MNLPNAKVVRRLRGTIDEYSVDNGQSWHVWRDDIEASIDQALPVVQDWNGDESVKAEALAALEHHKAGLAAFR